LPTGVPAGADAAAVEPGAAAVVVGVAEPAPGAASFLPPHATSSAHAIPNRTFIIIINPICPRTAGRLAYHRSNGARVNVIQYVHPALAMPPITV